MGVDVGDPNEVSNIPGWLQLSLAALIGAVTAIGTMIRLVFAFNTRLQKIENQELDAVIDQRIAKDRHENIYPMLQVRVFAELDKQSDSLAHLDRNVAVLLERDRLAQRMEKIISALNRDALNNQD